MWSTILAAVTQAAGEHSSTGGVQWAQILLSIVGPAGLIGSIVALLKLKPDANSQAVTQAQGAASEWQKIADERQRDKERLQAQLDAKNTDLERAEVEIDRLRGLRHPGEKG